jgi:hypothetical protein
MSKQRQNDGEERDSRDPQTPPSGISGEGGAIAPPAPSRGVGPQELPGQLPAAAPNIPVAPPRFTIRVRNGNFSGSRMGLAFIAGEARTDDPRIARTAENTGYEVSDAGTGAVINRRRFFTVSGKTDDAQLAQRLKAMGLKVDEHSPGST